ncbi:MAG: hypothetical protein FWE36_06935 [Erysipelotrichales bacterium]|nr:hypothetical protein [Erysipelotrichales bacterium]
MNKKFKMTFLFTILFLSLITLAGCSANNIFAWYEGSSENDETPIVMNAGETLTIDKSYFAEIDFAFERFELWIHSQRLQQTKDSSIVEIKDNTITAKESGHVTIAATLIQSRVGNAINQLGVFIGSFYIINESTMTHITTAEELANINNNLSDHFILMADIDLTEYEWVSLGDGHNEFKGMFVNPYGYTIDNLTIRSGKNARGFGLFGQIYRYAFISGVILENIFIDVSDYEGNSLIVGGLVGTMMQNSMILDFSVSGSIISGGVHTGGVVGLNNFGIIKNGSFMGNIENHNVVLSSTFAIGGIAGFNAFIPSLKNTANIINVTVNADLDGGSLANVGGIVGVTNFSNAIENASFIGTVIGRRAGTKVGFINLPGADYPVNFE